MEYFLRNVRYAVRVLLRTPGFTLTVVLTLALGIGANSAVLSVIDTVLLQPLSFPDADRLVRVRQVKEKETMIAPARLDDWRGMNSVFDGLTGYYVEDVSDTTGDLPERVRRAVVTNGFIPVWGVEPALGRGFTDDEYRAGAPAVVIISDWYWRDRLRSDPNVLGKTVRIENQSYSIVGVMPPSFRFPERDVSFFWPYPADNSAAPDRQLQWYTGIGRLRPNVTLEQARADLAVVQSQLANQYPDSDRDVGISMVLLKEAVVGGTRGSLWLLFGAVCVLLLIACTNIAALLVSRVAERQQQIAVRFALGASRSAVALQLLAETVVLALAGAAVGLLVANGARAAFRVLAPRLPRLDEVGFDGRMFLYTLATAAVVALLCGLFPAIRSARVTQSLSAAGRTQVSSRNSIQWLLVGIQVALSVTLLTGAGLLVRSYDELARVDPGFDPTDVLVFRVSGNWSEENDRARLVQRLSGTLEELRTLPGVKSAATAWQLPGIPTQYGIEFELVEGRSSSEQPLMAEWRTVSPAYFDVTRIALVGGETCRLPSSAQGTQEVMVNSSFVSRYFADRSAIGLNLAWEDRSQSGRIVGIVGDARESGMDSNPSPTVYACDTAPSPFPWFLLRTSGEPLSMANSVRLKMQQLEPLRSVYAVAPLKERIGEAYAQHRLRMSLLILFAATALALTCLGIYGTLSYIISLRRREVGLRMALGAFSTSIVWQFLLKVLRVVGIACVVGILLSLALSRGLSGMLYGVSPWDPATLLAVLGVVVVVATFAALLPAIRASRIEPMQALREE